MGDSKHASTRGMVCFVECKQGTLCRQESAWTLTQMHMRSLVLMLACTSCAYARVACTRACVCWCKCACRHWHATHSPSAQDPAHKLLDVLVSPGLVDVMQNEDNLANLSQVFDRGSQETDDTKLRTSSFKAWRLACPFSK